MHRKEMNPSYRAQDQVNTRESNEILKIVVNDIVDFVKVQWSYALFNLKMCSINDVYRFSCYGAVAKQSH